MLRRAATSLAALRRPAPAPPPPSAAAHARRAVWCPACAENAQLSALPRPRPSPGSPLPPPVSSPSPPEPNPWDFTARPFQLLTHVTEHHPAEARYLLPSAAIARCLHAARCIRQLRRLLLVLCAPSVSIDRIAAVANARCGDAESAVLLFTKGADIETYQARLSRYVAAAVAVLPPDGPAQEESLLHVAVSLLSRLSQLAALGVSPATAAAESHAPVVVPPSQEGSAVGLAVAGYGAAADSSTPPPLCVALAAAAPNAVPDQSLPSLTVTILTSSSLVSNAIPEVYPCSETHNLQVHTLMLDPDEE